MPIDFIALPTAWIIVKFKIRENWFFELIELRSRARLRRTDFNSLFLRFLDWIMLWELLKLRVLSVLVTGVIPIPDEFDDSAWFNLPNAD